MKAIYIIFAVFLPLYVISSDIVNYKYAGLEKEETPVFSGSEQIYLHSLNIKISEREYPGFVYVKDREYIFKKAYLDVDDAVCDIPLVFLTDRTRNPKSLSIDGRDVQYTYNWMSLELSPVKYDPFFFPLSGFSSIILYSGGPEVESSDNSQIKFENLPVKVEEPSSSVFLSDGNFNTERYRFFAGFSMPHVNTSVCGERNLTSGFGRLPDTSYGSVTVSSIIYSDWLKLPLDFIYSGGDVDRFQLNKTSIGYRLFSLEPQFNPNGSVSPFIKFGAIYSRNTAINKSYNIGSGLRFGNGEFFTLTPSFDIKSVDGEKTYNILSEVLLRNEGRYLISSGSQLTFGDEKRFNIRLSGSLSIAKYLVPFASYTIDLWSQNNWKTNGLISGIRFYLQDRVQFQSFLKSSNISGSRLTSTGGIVDCKLIWGFNINGSCFYNLKSQLDIPRYLISTDFGYEREFSGGIIPSVYFGVQNVGGVTHSQDLVRNGNYNTKSYIDTSLKGAITIRTIEIFSCFNNLFNRRISIGGSIYPPEPRNYQFGIYWIMNN